MDDVALDIHEMSIQLAGVPRAVTRPATIRGYKPGTLPLRNRMKGQGMNG